MEAIKILENGFDPRVLKKIENAVTRTHCDKYKVQAGHTETSVIVPRHKTQRIRELLKEEGLKNY